MIRKADLAAAMNKYIRNNRDELIDPKQPENITCTMMKYGDNYYGDHTAGHSTLCQNDSKTLESELGRMKTKLMLQQRYFIL